jgi:cytoskeletal protein RodZ
MSANARIGLALLGVLIVGGVVAAVIELGGSESTHPATSSAQIRSSASSTVRTTSASSLARTLSTAHSSTATSAHRSTARVTPRPAHTTSSTTSAPASRTVVHTTATASTTVAVADKGELHLVHAVGNTLIEEGQATGTLPGIAQVKLDVNTAKGVATASVRLTRPDGTLASHSSGRTEGGHGGWEDFSGTMSIEHGSGEYANASGSGQISGQINRRTDRLLVEVSGTLRY